MISKRKHKALMATCLGFLLCATGAAWSDGLPILEALASYDHEFLSGYSLEISIEETAGEHSVYKGKTVSTAQISGNGSVQVLARETTAIEGKAQDPASEKGGTLSSLRFAPLNAVHVCLEDGLCKIRRQNSDLEVAKDGQIQGIKGADGVAIDIVPDSVQSCGYQFYSYLLALGRGYSQLIDSVSSAKTDENGICSVVAEGHFFAPERKGIWNLEIDTANGFLVRKAKFFYAHKGPDWPGGTAFESSGVSEGDVPLATAGSAVIWGTPPTLVSLQAYAREANSAVLKSAQKAVNNEGEFHQPATIADFVLGDGEPVFSRVP